MMIRHPLLRHQSNYYYFDPKSRVKPFSSIFDASLGNVTTLDRSFYRPWFALGPKPTKDLVDRTFPTIFVTEYYMESLVVAMSTWGLNASAMVFKTFKKNSHNIGNDEQLEPWMLEQHRSLYKRDYELCARSLHAHLGALAHEAPGACSRYELARSVLTERMAQIPCFAGRLDDLKHLMSRVRTFAGDQVLDGDPARNPPTGATYVRTHVPHHGRHERANMRARAHPSRRGSSHANRAWPLGRASRG